MDDAKAFLLGLMQTARERFGNPLIGAFAIAWAIWNFRIILVLVGNGDGGWKAKLEHIDTVLMPTRWVWFWHGYFWPTCFALAWIYVLPPLLRKIAADHEKNLNRNREAIFSITEARTLSVDEAMYMRQVMLKQRAEWQTEKADNLQALENYSRKIEEVNEEMTALRKSISTKDHEITQLQKEIQELKAPPPPVPFNFSGQTTEAKASAIGLRFDTLPSPEKEPSLVQFDGKNVQWPWMPTEGNKINIPNDRFTDKPIDEIVLCAMLFLGENYASSPSRKPLPAWAQYLRNAGFQRCESIIRTLYHSGILQGNSDSPELPPHSVSFIQWLRIIGFSRSNTETTMSKTPDITYLPNPNAAGQSSSEQT